MQSRRTFVAVLILLVARPLTGCAADVTAKVIDGLGRPVSGAMVDIHWLKSVSKNDVRKIDLVKLVSDREGVVKGRYDEKSIPKGEDIWVEVSKSGYSGYTTTSLKPEFVLQREFGAADLRRIAKLERRRSTNFGSFWQEILRIQDNGKKNWCSFMSIVCGLHYARSWATPKSELLQANLWPLSACRMTYGFSLITLQPRRESFLKTVGLTGSCVLFWNRLPRKNGHSCAIAR